MLEVDQQVQGLRAWGLLGWLVKGLVRGWARLAQVWGPRVWVLEVFHHRHLRRRHLRKR